MSAPGYEYDPEEWQRYVNNHQLEYIPEKEMTVAEIRELLKK